MPLAKVVKKPVSFSSSFLFPSFFLLLSSSSAYLIYTKTFEGFDDRDKNRYEV